MHDPARAGASAGGKKIVTGGEVLCGDFVVACRAAIELIIDERGVRSRNEDR